MAAASFAQASEANNFPNQPIKIVVPYAAGGGTDIMARQVGRTLSEVLKQPVIIDNKPGAGTAIGANAVANSAPNGYTLLWGDNATYATNTALYKKLSYDPLHSLKPVSTILTGSLVLSVNKAIPVNNVKEFIDYVKSNPQQMSYGTAGNGTPHHLMMEALKITNDNLNIVHIPYQGEGPAMQDLVGGQLQAMFSGARIASAQSKEGKIKVLAASGKERNQILPEIPTIAESGSADFVHEYWHGISVPAGTPDEIISKLNAAFKQTLANKELTQWIATTSGAYLQSSTPAEMTEKINNDIIKAKDLVTKIGLSLD
ncbi:MAG: tripartite tricarboxylate transporter substrate binding protein [Alcaligenaceae bacterium]|nr:tripartite tricarboxylate transporter substrate binding protein [Alcaligenaceae bacterium]